MVLSALLLAATAGAAQARHEAVAATVGAPRGEATATPVAPAQAAPPAETKRESSGFKPAAVAFNVVFVVLTGAGYALHRRAIAIRPPAMPPERRP
jgi:hypothetical protein